jgi:phosphoribosylanthranilate isomerase
MWNKNQKYTRIKLCLFEYLEAAYEASYCGADALGFHILKSNKENWNTKAQKFRDLINFLPDTIEKVLLIDYDLNIIADCMNIAKFDSIQLYPDCSSNDIYELRKKINRPIKILKVMSAQLHENDPPNIEDFILKYENSVDAFLLDSCREGGSGKIADLNICSKIINISPIPVFLAGGLNPENVSSTILAAQPFGVDVETGVSTYVKEVGLIKNLAKCYDFVSEVKKIDQILFDRNNQIMNPK